MTGIPELLAQRRRRQQVTLFRVLDRQQVLALAGAEEPRRVDGRKECLVAQQTMCLGIRTRRDGRRIHAGYGRIDGVMVGNHSAARSEDAQIGHQLRGHVIGPETVEHNQKMAQTSGAGTYPTIRPTRARTARHRDGKQHESEKRGRSRLTHSWSLCADHSAVFAEGRGRTPNEPGVSTGDLTRAPVAIEHAGRE